MGGCPACRAAAGGPHVLLRPHRRLCVAPSTNMLTHRACMCDMGMMPTSASAAARSSGYIHIHIHAGPGVSPPTIPTAICAASRIKLRPITRACQPARTFQGAEYHVGRVPPALPCVVASPPAACISAVGMADHRYTNTAVRMHIRPVWGEPADELCTSRSQSRTAAELAYRVQSRPEPKACHVQHRRSS